MRIKSRLLLEFRARANPYGLTSPALNAASYQMWQDDFVSVLFMNYEARIQEKDCVSEPTFFPKHEYLVYSLSA